MSFFDHLFRRRSEPQQQAAPTPTPATSPARDARRQLADDRKVFAPVPEFSAELAAAIAAVYCDPDFQQQLQRTDSANGWTPSYKRADTDPLQHARWSSVHMNGDRTAVRDIEKAENEKEWAKRKNRLDFAPRRLDWRAGALSAACAALPDCDSEALAPLVNDHAADLGRAIFASDAVDDALRTLWNVPVEKPVAAAAPADDNPDSPNPLVPATWPAMYAWGMLNPKADTAVTRWGWQSHQLRKTAFAREMAKAVEPDENAVELADLL